MRTRATELAHGPYKHRSRYRVVVSGSDGSRRYRSFETEREALDYVNAYRCAATSGERTIGQAVRDYLEHVAIHGNHGEGMKPRSMDTLRCRLLGILRLVERDRVLLELHAEAAAGLYARRTTETKPDTHRAELAMVRRFTAWCVAQGWLPVDPFAGVKAIGRKARGKPQLRVNEAKRYLDAALSEGTPYALAAAMPLVLGLRASEVVDRVARDVDDGGRMLWIPTSKTRAGVRELEVPAVLRDRLLALVSGKAPTDRIFPALTRFGLGYHVARLCEVAGVPKVCPHGLRGMHATIGVRSGVSVEHVAAALGHAGSSVTTRHYVGAGAIESAGAERMARVLSDAVEGN